MSAIRSTAVIGATGMLGRPVTEALLEAGFRVRIVARDPDRARRQFARFDSRQLDVVAGDLREVASLERALAGQDAVYLNLSVRQTEKSADFHTETDGIQNLLEAARSHNLQRIGYLSSLVLRYQGTNGFHWWAFDVKQEAVRLLKNSGIPSSIFYPTSFMDTLPGTQQLGRFILVVGQSPVKLYYIAARDYGQQVARAFQRAENGQSQAYIIQGLEPFTQTEAARQFVKHYRKEKLLVVTAPHAMVKLAGRFVQQANYGAAITEALNNYPEQFEAEQTWAELGKPQTTLRQFAEQFR